MSSKTRVYSMNTARICIDHCGGAVSGRVYSKLWAMPLIFSGLGEMILGMDQMFNKCGYPQAYQESRSFREQPKRTVRWSMPEPKVGDEEIDRQSGKCRTFDVVIQSRRQSGWQGILMETDRSALFRFNSEMELLSLICRKLEGRLLTG